MIRLESLQAFLHQSTAHGALVVRDTSIYKNKYQVQAISMTISYVQLFFAPLEYIYLMQVSTELEHNVHCATNLGWRVGDLATVFPIVASRVFLIRKFPWFVLEIRSR